MSAIVEFPSVQREDGQKIVVGTHASLPMPEIHPVKKDDAEVGKGVSEHFGKSYSDDEDVMTAAFFASLLGVPPSIAHGMGNAVLIAEEFENDKKIGNSNVKISTLDPKSSMKPTAFIPQKIIDRTDVNGVISLNSTPKTSAKRKGFINT